jgi:magnesium chelatase family protein
LGTDHDKSLRNNDISSISMASMARERGLLRLIVPEANAREAAVVTGVQAFPIRSLPHVVELLNGKNPGFRSR